MRLGHLNNNTTQTEKKLAQEVLTFSHVSQGIDDLLSERGVRSESQLGFTRGPTRGIYNNDSHVKVSGVFFYFNRSNMFSVSKRKSRRAAEESAVLRTVVLPEKTWNLDLFLFVLGFFFIMV